MVYPYNGILFSIKKNILLHGTTWMNIKSIMLSERSQTQNVTYCMILLIWFSGKGNTIRTETRSVIARGQKWQDGVDHKGARGNFEGVIELLYLERLRKSLIRKRKYIYNTVLYLPIFLGYTVHLQVFSSCCTSPKIFPIYLLKKVHI